MKSARFTFALIGLAVTVLLAGCGTVEISGLKDVLSGSDYLSSLHKAGKLPGVNSDSSLYLNSTPISFSSFSTSNQLQTLKFWLTVPEKTNTVVWYQITRNDRQAPWTLNYAVQADTNGQNSVDLLKAPVPDSKEIELEAKSKSQ